MMNTHSTRAVFGRTQITRGKTTLTPHFVVPQRKCGGGKKPESRRASVVCWNVLFWNAHSFTLCKFNWNSLLRGGEGRGMRRLLSRGAFNVFPHFFFVAFLFLLYVCRHRPKRDKYFVCLESHFVSIWESFQLGQRERRTEACTRLN